MKKTKIFLTFMVFAICFLSVSCRPQRSASSSTEKETSREQNRIRDTAVVSKTQIASKTTGQASEEEKNPAETEKITNEAEVKSSETENQTSADSITSLYVGTLIYDDISFTIQNDSSFEEHNGKFFKTGIGNFALAGGASAWPGSTLSTEAITKSVEYESSTLIIFTYESDLEGDSLTGAFDKFAEEISIDNNELIKPIRWLAENEGDAFCLLFEKQEELEGTQIWFRMNGADIVLAVKE